MLRPGQRPVRSEHLGGRDPPLWQRRQLEAGGEQQQHLKEQPRWEQVVGVVRK